MRLTKEMEHIFLEWNQSCWLLEADKRDNEDRVTIAIDRGELRVLRRIVEDYCEKSELLSSKCLMQVLHEHATDGIKNGKHMPDDAETLKFIHEFSRVGKEGKADA